MSGNAHARAQLRAFTPMHRCAHRQLCDVDMKRPVHTKHVELHAWDVAHGSCIVPVSRGCTCMVQLALCLVDRARGGFMSAHEPPVTPRESNRSPPVTSCGLNRSLPITFLFLLMTASQQHPAGAERIRDSSAEKCAQLRARCFC